MLVYCKCGTISMGMTRAQLDLEYPKDKRPFICKKCNTEIFFMVDTPPKFRSAKEYKMSCPHCYEFEQTTTCTAFGAKLEGKCKEFLAYDISFGDVCDFFHNDMTEMRDKWIDWIKKIASLRSKDGIFEQLMMHMKEKKHEKSIFSTINLIAILLAKDYQDFDIFKVDHDMLIERLENFKEKYGSVI